MSQKSQPNLRQPSVQPLDPIEPWDLNKTNGLVERVFGREQRAIVHPCLRSIVDRQYFARYHYGEADRLLKAFQRKHLSNQHLLVAIHGGNESSRIAFENLMIKAGAHVTACIQAMHAIPDILASGVYFALGLNRSPDALSDRSVNIANVTNHIMREPSYVNLAVLLDEVRTGSGYEHVSAISNLSKHRTVIRHSLNQDMTGTRKELHEFQITSFEKATKGGGKHYPAISLADLLTPEFFRVGGLVVRIGHKIDEVLELKIS
jgi:hypothetical protein